MAYPIIEINLTKLRENTEVMVEYFRQRSIEIMGVNKVFNGSEETAQAMYDGGLKVIAESVPANLAKLKGVDCQKGFLRSPGLSEVPDVIRYSHISLVSSREVIREMSKEAVRQSKEHQILVMVDMGDLREGIWYTKQEEIEGAVLEVVNSPGLSLYGLGTNFGCYGTVLPTEENNLEFVRLARSIEDRCNIKFPYLSGGNSISYYLVDSGKMADGINHLRIGGQHIFGMEYVEGRYLEGYHHSDMPVSKGLSSLCILKGEVIEVGEKPTVPVGTLWLDAFMEKKTFKDRGIRKRALIAFGRQDVPWENICPVDGDIEILGQTSNHTIIDIEEREEELQIGDILAFQVDYTGLMHLCNGQNVEKIYI